MRYRNNTKHRFVCIDKPTHRRIVIPTLEVVHGDFFVIVVTSVAEGVDGCDIAIGSVADNGANAPGIVAITGNRFSVLVDDRNDVALQILQEIVRRAVVNDAARGILYIIQRNQLIVAP